MKNYRVISFLLLGIGVRLIYSLFFTTLFDFDNILAMAKSVADTGSMVGGVNALSRLGFNTQLYGKIYYQIIGEWLKMLDALGLIKIDLIFDVKPFTDYATYLIGLWQWSPPVYQLALIKLIQFVWDILFLVFLYLNAYVLNKKHAYLAVLFWAVTPFFMMINYAFLMPDIFMLACLLGGTFFWMMAIKQSGKLSVFYSLLSLAFLVLGAVIKQLPLLLIPILILTISKNIKSVGIYSFFSIFVYFIFRQDWSHDSNLINTNFMFSNESTAILSHAFNAVPYLFYFYGFFVLFLLRVKNQFFINPRNIILIVLCVITIVYINDPVSFMQFSIWFLPFVFLLALNDRKYTWIYFVGIISVLIKLWRNDVYLSLLLSPTIGSFYNNTLGNEYFVGYLASHKIYNLVLHSLVIFIYAIVFIESIGLLFKSKSIFSDFFVNLGFNKIKIHQIILLGLFAYILLVGVDYLIKSRFILLPQKQHQLSGDKIHVSRNPLKVHFFNPKKKEISAIEIPIMQIGKSYGETIFDFRKNGKSFIKMQSYDSVFPVNTDQPLKLILPKPFVEEYFDLYIYKNSDTGNVALPKSKILSEVNFNQSSIFGGYEIPSDNELLQPKYDSHVFAVFFHGKYDFQDIQRAFRHHTNSKIKLYFFTSYIACGLVFILTSGLIYFLGHKLFKDKYPNVL